MKFNFKIYRNKMYFSYKLIFLCFLEKHTGWILPSAFPFILFFASMLKIRLNIIFPQWIASIGVLLVFLQIGTIVGCVSPMLAKLTSANSPIMINKDEGSWMASLANLGRLFGAVIGSIIAAYYGTKRSILISVIPMVLGWLCIGFAGSVETLYLARISSGIAIGMAFSCFPLYLGEIAIPEIRGAMVSLATCGGSMGVLLGATTTNYLTISASAFVYLGLCIVLASLFLYLPESPHHLIKVGNQKAAMNSISWYRAGKGVQEEFEAVETFVASERSITLLNRLQELRKSNIRKATYHVMILFTFMQICGLNSIIFYMEIILRKAKCTIINPADVVIYANLLSIGAATIAIFLSDKLGRRFLLLLSSTGVAVSMIMMFSHFFIISINIDVTNLQWLPIMAILVFILFFNVGLNSVPSTVTSEIIPANVKCLVGCLGSLTAGIVAFLSSKTYQPMVDLLGEPYVYLIYAFFSLAAAPYVLFFMPETKGKTLQEIQDDLMGK